MAHFALIGNNNVVENVLYVDNSLMLDGDGNESEEMGIAQCRKGLGKPNARLIKTSYNHSIRRRSAGVGFTYDETHDVFLTPKPYPSWVLNTTTYHWDPPTVQPTAITATPEQWVWQESSTSWVKESIPEPEAIEGGTYSWNTTDTFWEWTETPE